MLDHKSSKFTACGPNESLIPEFYFLIYRAMILKIFEIFYTTLTEFIFQLQYH